MPFRLGTVLSSNPIRLTLSMHILYTRLPALNNATMLNGLLLTTVASRNFIPTEFKEKGTFGVLTLSHKMCPRKQTAEPKLVILVSFF